MSKIREFYRGKTILITGGTGFMGKVLIEKLLYSCSDLKKIFLLVRSKKDMSVNDRVKELISSPAFDRVKSEKPEVLEKIVPIQGDVELINMGIGEVDLLRVLAETEIVFNVAAAVDFLVNVESSFKGNVLSLVHLTQIAKKMTSLQVLMHVSTGFCFRDRDDVEEMFYDSKLYRWVVNDIENAKDYLTIASNSALHGHQCTYSFTKRLAEMVANEEQQNLPICVVRPSIVHAAISEPHAGWIDGEMSPAGEIISIAKGLKRSTMSNKKYILNIVPVDSIIRSMISIAWEYGTKPEKPSSLPVYNVSIPHEKALSVGSYCKLLTKYMTRYPYEVGLWFPNLRFVSNRKFYKLRIALFQLLPAHIIDSLFKLIEKKPFLVKTQDYIIAMQDVIDSYTNVKLKFSIDKITRIDRMLEGEDKRDFQTFPDDMNMQKFYESAVEGIRHFMLKESRDNTTRTLVLLGIIKVIDVFVKLSVIVMPCIFLLKIFTNLMD